MAKEHTDQSHLLYASMDLYCKQEYSYDSCSLVFGFGECPSGSSDYMVAGGSGRSQVDFSQIGSTHRIACDKGEPEIVKSHQFRSSAGGTPSPELMTKASSRRDMIGPPY